MKKFKFKDSSCSFSPSFTNTNNSNNNSNSKEVGVESSAAKQSQKNPSNNSNTIRFQHTSSHSTSASSGDDSFSSNEHKEKKQSISTSSSSLSSSTSSSSLSSKLSSKNCQNGDNSTIQTKHNQDLFKSGLHSNAVLSYDSYGNSNVAETGSNNYYHTSSKYSGEPNLENNSCNSFSNYHGTYIQNNDGLNLNGIPFNDNCIGKTSSINHEQSYVTNVPLIMTNPEYFQEHQQMNSLNASFVSMDGTSNSSLSSSPPHSLLQKQHHQQNPIAANYANNYYFFNNLDTSVAAVAATEKTISSNNFYLTNNNTNSSCINELKYENNDLNYANEVASFDFNKNSYDLASQPQFSNKFQAISGNLNQTNENAFYYLPSSSPKVNINTNILSTQLARPNSNCNSPTGGASATSSYFSNVFMEYPFNNSLNSQYLTNNYNYNY
jgi:hypothetical protein